MDRREDVIMLTRKRFKQYFVISLLNPSVVIGSHQVLSQIQGVAPRIKIQYWNPLRDRSIKINLIIATGLRAIPHDVQDV